MATVYITPTGSGSGDGSSWDNAATLAQINTLISRAGPGGQVLLRADLGAYQISKEIAVVRGGTAGSPVTISGVDGAGQPAAAVISGARDATWRPGEATGGEGFRLLAGADNLSFQHLDMRNLGAAFRVGADLRDLSIEHVTASNVSRFFQNLASGANASATVDGLVLRDVSVEGYSDKAVFLQYDTHRVLLENVRADAGGQEGQYLMGVHLAGTVHDVTLRSVTMNNNRDTVSGPAAYRQGDGFTTERGVHHVRFERTSASGNTDAGYDLKSSHTTLVETHAEGNSRNYRLWGDEIVLDRVTGLSPVHHGGVGQPAQVWLAAGANVAVVDSDFRDARFGGMIFDAESGAVLNVSGGRLLNDVSGWVARLSDAAAVSGLASTTNNGLRITGSLASERLEGDDGADRLEGGGGDDVIDGAGGDDVMIGGEGRDAVSYASATAGVTVSLGRAGPQDTGRGLDAISSVEDLVGSAYADRLEGNAGGNVLTGGGGDDLFVFGKGWGADTVADFVAGGAEDRVEIAGYLDWIRLEQVGADTVITFSETDSLRLANVKVEALTSADFVWLDRAPPPAAPAGARLGTAAADTLNGGSRADVLYGLDGNDVLDGKAGADRLVGGRGDDVYHVDSAADVVVEQFGEGRDTVHASVSWTLGEHFETLFLRTNVNSNGVGNGSANTLNGNSGMNRLEGLGGDDVLNGHGGADRLIGGAGADQLSGGPGDDRFVFGQGGGADVITDFVAGGSEDRIEISGYTAWTRLEQVGADVLIVFSDADSLLLRGVQAAALAPADFLWT